MKSRYYQQPRGSSIPVMLFWERNNNNLVELSIIDSSVCNLWKDRSWTHGLCTGSSNFKTTKAVTLKRALELSEWKRTRSESRILVTLVLLCWWCGAGLSCSCLCVEWPSCACGWNIVQTRSTFVLCFLCAVIIDMRRTNSSLIAKWNVELW